MLHPRAHGTVTWMAPAGEYGIAETIMKTDFQGTETEHAMLQVGSAPAHPDHGILIRRPPPPGVACAANATGG